MLYLKNAYVLKAMISLMEFAENVKLINSSVTPVTDVNADKASTGSTELAQHVRLGMNTIYFINAANSKIHARLMKFT